MSKTTIVLADDHPIVREGVRGLLATADDVVVVGEEGDGLKVLDLVERLRPHVLILDIMMPGLNGLDVLRRVSRQFPRLRVIVLSMHSSEGYVLEAMRNGATAYVVKDAMGTELVKAVREAAAGRRYLSPPLSERAIEVYLGRMGASGLDSYEALTAREREVLRLAAEGFSASEIAARLSISPRTAETHRANLMHKLGLHSQTDLVRYAMRRGALPSEKAGEA